MSLTSPISQELIDLIIDCVASYSSDSERPGSTFQHCALVSRAFRPRSQAHLFSTINLGRGSETRTGTRDDKILGLLNIIQANTLLADHIAALGLECVDLACSWIYENPAFLEMMKKISTSEKPLRKLTLRMDAWDVDNFEIYPFENPEPLRDIFFLPFIAPFITCLSLHRLSNPPMELVTSCINLVDLELLHVEWQENNSTKISSPHVIHLRSLKHRLSRGALDALRAPSSTGSVPPLDISNLHSFTVYTDDLPDLDYEQKIIDAAHKSLEVIHMLTLDTPRKTLVRSHVGRAFIDNVTGNRDFHSAPDLRSCTRLRQLHAHVLFPEDSLSSIRQMLSTVRSGSLEKVHINAKVAFYHRDDTPPEGVLDADWGDFCAELARAMCATAAAFEFKLTYLYKDRNEITWNEDVKTGLGGRCRVILAALRREQLGMLDDSRFSVTLSYDLEYKYTHIHRYLRRY